MNELYLAVQMFAVITIIVVVVLVVYQIVRL